MILCVLKVHAIQALTEALHSLPSRGPRPRLQILDFRTQNSTRTWTSDLGLQDSKFNQNLDFRSWTSGLKIQNLDPRPGPGPRPRPDPDPDPDPDPNPDPNPTLDPNPNLRSLNSALRTQDPGTRTHQNPKPGIQNQMSW